ncbi:hypothetical protein [Leisingera methylohalidivorans]|uniref:hypothetical protein n=1 Tax=Leisingera methylohalidivorans TaxID=133924 RepID=UPI003CCB7BFE
MTERHEVIFAEGIATETFWPCPEAVRGLCAAGRRELFGLFPDPASAQCHRLPGREAAGPARGGEAAL